MTAGTGVASIAVCALLVAGCGADTGATATSSNPETLTVLAAASLTESFSTLAADYERSHPDVRIALSFGASSTLAAQAAEGAPADVFASASSATMATAVKSGQQRIRGLSQETR